MKLRGEYFGKDVGEAGGENWGGLWSYFVICIYGSLKDKKRKEKLFEGQRDGSSVKYTEEDLGLIPSNYMAVHNHL